MYAIVDIAGQQFKVEKDQQIFVHRLEGKEGSSVNFDNVLLIDDNGKIKVGAPAIEGAQVKAKILTHDKGDKVIVFKKKRRKGYRVRNGHRQYMTQIQIENIAASGAKKTEAVKAEPVKAEPAKAEAKSTTKAAEPKKATATKKASTTTTAKKPAKAAAATKKAEPKTTKTATAKKTTTKASAAKKPAAAKKSPAKKDDKK